MSGHSKWSKVKHQKAGTDAAKSAAFTKVSRALTIAVRQGAGITDPNKNYHLRLAIEKAHEVNMPKDTIARAIERGGTAEGSALEEILYEGYAPGGIALIIEAATDNKSRTVSEIKHVLERGEGRLAAPGSVDFLFDRVGALTLSAISKSFDELFELALNAGADDVVMPTGSALLYTKVELMNDVRVKLEEMGIPVMRSEVIMKPKMVVDVSPEIESALRELTRNLEGLDDVLRVYTDAHLV